MAEETDPETAALLREMHRELNGLTRHRSRVSSLEPKLKRQRMNESQSSTSDESRKLEAEHASKRGLQPNTSGPRPLKRLQKQASTVSAQDKPARKQSAAGQSEPAERKQAPQPPANGAARQREPDHRQDETSRAGPEAKGSRRSVADQGTSSPRPVPAGMTKQPSTDAASGWTHDQASAAKSEAQDKAQRPRLPAEAYRFKCFCQGVVYGLSLKCEALRSREALRLALQAVLDEEQYAGLEEGMQVILISDAGQISEFVPSASDSKWPSLAPRIRRAYVSPVQ